MNENPTEAASTRVQFWRHSCAAVSGGCVTVGTF
jgi:hypothetical protein